eukprot:CAMPEP_0114583056 /NCGR_PEP_ID=MMETSP0125-20121206/6880_1 /TAXON_ID=485358 ORGANISM="Aristerostoma sp., Strain ATCC 50986" /NCGR_SAMPLE_ID=MMETSP0125 /ASSEMBLY_ACC=CAM_ASM_000245 /LENGTH=316 /DNA_ID=CAMNT_0001776313 /DNA_START=476 /DNA_END=1426 /DNA_ORIENTATION=-
MQSNDNIDIIKSEQQHQKDITKFHKGLASETENIELDDKVISKGVGRLFKDDKYGVYYSAVENNKPVGCVMNIHDYHHQLDKPTYWIQNVYVDPKARGKGVFKSLFDHTIQEAKKANANAVKLYVDKGNEQAKKVYQRLGMNDSRQIVYEVDWSGEKSLELEPLENLRNFKFELLNYENLREMEAIQFKHLIGDNNTDKLNLKGLKAILDKKISCKVVVIRENLRIVGVTSSFMEWSEWRNGVMPWVYDVKIRSDIDAQDYKKYFKIMMTMTFLGCGSLETAFRIIFKENKHVELFEAMKEMNMDLSHYSIYKISL